MGICGCGWGHTVGPSQAMEDGRDARDADQVSMGAVAEDGGVQADGAAEACAPAAAFEDGMAHAPAVAPMQLHSKLPS